MVLTFEMKPMISRASMAEEFDRTTLIDAGSLENATEFLMTRFVLCRMSLSAFSTDVWRASVVHAQLICIDGPLKAIWEIDDVVRRTAAKAIDGLIVVAANNEGGLLRDVGDELKVQSIDVLELVNNDLCEL